VIGIFDGIAWGYQQFCGTWVILYLRDTHIIKFKTSLGRGLDNFAELIVLKWLLVLASEKGASEIQFFWNIK